MSCLANSYWIEDGAVKCKPVVLFVLDNVTLEQYNNLVNHWRSFLQDPDRKHEQRTPERIPAGFEWYEDPTGWHQEWNGSWFLT